MPNCTQRRVTLDRIDSAGHYTPDNLQVVCRFMNRWKGADDDSLVRCLIDVLQGSSAVLPQV